jgi:hypothetical protein
MSEHLEHETLVRMIKQASKIVPDETQWRHRKTQTIYRVVTLAFSEKDCEIQVVYCSIDSLWVKWTRPLNEWLDGRFEPIRDSMTKVTDELVELEWNYRRKQIRGHHTLIATFPGLFASAITKGWSFTGQSVEDHDKDVQDLKRKAEDWMIRTGKK